MNRSRALALLFTLTAFVAVLSAHPAEARGKPSGGRGTLALSSDNVVPFSGELGCGATATVTARKGEVCFSVTVNTLSSLITTIGIYRAPVGQTGPMVVRLSPSPIGINQLLGCVPADDEVVRDISRNPAAYYIQINTQSYPNGAMRAQLK